MTLSFYDIADLEDGFGATAGRRRPHRGLDIPRAGGTPIPAWADGTVVISQWHNGLGWVVETDSGTVFPGYCHMRAQGVPVGTRVKVGDTIGYVGTTGSESGGNHLHATAGNRRGAVFGESMDYLTDPWPLIRAAQKSVAEQAKKGADDMPRILNMRETPDGKVNTATIFFDGGPGVGIKGISNPYHLGLLQRFIADKPGDHMFPAELAIINTYMAPNAPTLTAATVEAAVAKAIKAAGGSAEAAPIAAAVETVLKDDFAAIPGATAVKLGEKLAAKQ